MRTTASFIIALCFLSARCVAQRPATTFTIHGIASPADTGRMILMPVNTEDYYPFHGTLVAPVVNGRFSFTDSIFYPTAYMIGLKHDSLWTYVSSPFYIDPGVQTLYCNLDSLREIPAITNATTHELLDNHALRIKDHRTFLSYVRNHPGSYVAFWKLVDAFSAGYDPFYDTLYHTFSDTIQQTYTGRILRQRLTAARIVCIGCRFPAVAFAPINDLSKRVLLPTTLSKYTLVDIWFSHCTPCIDQFAGYKSLYSRFKDRGFQLMGVSTDSKDQILHWREIIRRHRLPWPQYLDENGTVAKEFDIIAWPSNFLIDERGIIIQKNISPKALELLLNTTLAKK